MKKKKNEVYTAHWGVKLMPSTRRKMREMGDDGFDAVPPVREGIEERVDALYEIYLREKQAARDNSAA